MTAARLGCWQVALRSARRLVELAADTDPKYQHAARHIAMECFERLEEPDDLERAVDAAAEFSLVDDDTIRSQRAFARALRGDFERAVAALGLTPDRLREARPDDQVGCASAFLATGRFHDAYPILCRNEAELSNPEGQLFLAQAALAALDTTTARAALGRVTEATVPLRRPPGSRSISSASSSKAARATSWPNST